MSNVDDIFSTGGLVVALNRGVEPTVYLGDSILSGVTVSEDDLSCSACGRPVKAPTRNTARFLAVNKVVRDGRCLRCPDVGPPLPPTDA